MWNPYISLILENTTSSCSTTSSGISAASSSARWLCTNQTKQVILHVSGFLYIQWQQITTKRDLANTGGGRGLSEGKIYYQLRKSAAPVEQLRLYKMLVHHRCFSAELLVDVIYWGKKTPTQQTNWLLNRIHITFDIKLIESHLFLTSTTVRRSLTYCLSDSISSLSTNLWEQIVV